MILFYGLLDLNKRLMVNFTLKRKSAKAERYEYCNDLLTIALLNKFSASQITSAGFLIEIHMSNDKQCKSRSVGFFRSQLIWMYTVC